MTRGRLVPLLLVAGVLALVSLSLLLGGGSEFTGTDNQAVAAVQEQDPGYQPWFSSVLPPLSPSVESGLFAAQAALGGAVLGYVIGRLRGRQLARRTTPSTSSAGTAARRITPDPRPAAAGARPGVRAPGGRWR